jgi:hypothetical protein
MTGNKMTLTLCKVLEGWDDNVRGPLSAQTLSDEMKEQLQVLEDAAQPNFYRLVRGDAERQIYLPNLTLARNRGKGSSGGREIRRRSSKAGSRSKRERR